MFEVLRSMQDRSVHVIIIADTFDKLPPDLRQAGPWETILGRIRVIALLSAIGGNIAAPGSRLTLVSAHPE
jgi:hypothetical protein